MRFGNKENRFKKLRSLTCSNSGIQTIKKWIESLTGSNRALQTNNKDQIKLNSLTCSNRYFANNLTIKNETKS